MSALVGLVTGFATWLFIAVDHLGVKFLWEQLPGLVGGVPEWVVSVTVVLLMTAAAAAIVFACKGRPFDTGAAEAEYDAHGRMDYRRILPGAAFALSSLFSGAAVGPEAPLVDINGGLGSLLADKFRAPPEQVRVMTYAGVAGAFSAFFGAAPVGAILAIELISPKAGNISRTSMVAGLASGSTAWATYLALGGHEIAPLFTFPSYSGLQLIDLAFALVVGVAGGVIGLGYGAVFVKARVKLLPLRERPFAAGIAGGVVTAIAAVVSPWLLFSGQSQVPDLLDQAATLGFVLLIGIGLAKLVFSIWGLSTAYFGGPLFPLMFAGTCLGLALHEVVPAIPQAVAVMAMIAGMVVAATAAPLSVTIFLAVLADPALVSVIAIAAVSAFIIRQAVAPTVPGVYRQTRASERERPAS